MEQIKVNNLFLQLLITPILEGLLAELGSTNIQTLLALAVFMNDKGECYPSENRLVSLLGLHDISSVSDRIKKLEETTWKNKPVLLVKRGKTRGKDGKYKFSVNRYRINKEIVTIFSDWSNNQMEIGIKMSSNSISEKDQINYNQRSNDTLTKRPLRGENKSIKKGKGLQKLEETMKELGLKK